LAIIVRCCQDCHTLFRTLDKLRFVLRCKTGSSNPCLSATAWRDHSSRMICIAFTVRG
jgi:hypothetical protein